jgi:hypothetical protein
MRGEWEIVIRSMAHTHEVAVVLTSQWNLVRKDWWSKRVSERLKELHP